VWWILLTRNARSQLASSRTRHCNSNAIHACNRRAYADSETCRAIALKNEKTLKLFGVID